MSGTEPGHFVRTSDHRAFVWYGIRLHTNTRSWCLTYLPFSYLHDCQQFVRCRGSTSVQSYILYGVPQGSVLELILFLLYTADLVKLVLVRNLHPHLYADDTQIYGSCSPDRAVALQEEISECIDDVATWMPSNRLQLNATKTEVLRCASTGRQSQLPDVPFTVGSDVVKSSRSFASAIWEFTSTRTSPWELTSWGPSPVVSLHCVKLGAYSAQWADQYCCRWSRHWSCLGWTMAASP